MIKHNSFYWIELIRNISTSVTDCKHPDAYPPYYPACARQTHNTIAAILMLYDLNTLTLPIENSYKLNILSH